MATAREQALTHAGDDDEDEEGVHHRDDGGEAGGDHLLEGLEAAEEADDAEGPHHAEDGDRQVDRPQRGQGEGDHDQVDEVPAVAEEWPQPVGEHVEEQLDGEDGGEEQVQVVEGAADVGGRAVVVHEGLDQLCLRYVGSKILELKGKGDYRLKTDTKIVSKKTDCNEFKLTITMNKAIKN